MILDYLNRASLYEGVCPHLTEAIEFAKSCENKPQGRYEMGKYGCYVLVQAFQTSLPSERNYELHRKFLDVQIVLEGEELMGVEDITKLTPLEEYNREKDFQALTGEGQNVIIKEGMFALLLPHDGHRPCCSFDAPTKLRKLVIKMPFEEEG